MRISPAPLQPSSETDKQTDSLRFSTAMCFWSLCDSFHATHFSYKPSSASNWTASRFHSWLVRSVCFRTWCLLPYFSLFRHIWTWQSGLDPQTKNRHERGDLGIIEKLCGSLVVRKQSDPINQVVSSEVKKQHCLILCSEYFTHHSWKLKSS